MNDRELETRMRDAFNALEPPDAVKQRTLARSRAARKARRSRFITALAACLVLGVAVFGIFRVGGAPDASVETTPGDQSAVAPLDMVATAFVDIDINPSIELQLNASDQVVVVNAMNDDGRGVIASLDLEGLPYEEAFAKLTKSEALAPYLSGDAYVQVSVSSEHERAATSGAAMSRFVRCGEPRAA